MKKFMLAMSVVASLAMSSLALADSATPASQCNVPPDHGIYSDEDILIGCIPAAQYSAAVAAQAGLSAQKLPLVAPGASVTDQYGVTEGCPAFYHNDCVSLVGTAQYMESMQSLARQLVAEEVTGQFPRFSGWVASVAADNN